MTNELPSTDYAGSYKCTVAQLDQFEP